MSLRLYRFVQLEFPWPLGPADGRYLLRDHAGEEAHHVLVLASLAAPVRARARRWGREPPPDAEPAVTGLGRATVVDPRTMDEDGAQAWLAAAAGDGADAAVAEALGWVNVALRAHRAAAADAGVHEVLAEQALAVRAGYGAGFEVAEGEWTAARVVPAPKEDAGPGGRGRRIAALRPQERLAALLSGRDAVLACEELVLRARADLDAGRPREAALQAHVALEAAVAELAAFRATQDMDERLAELEGLRPRLAGAAREALHGGPSVATVDGVAVAVGRVEAALRARAASASY